jgi:catabolite regulation protein CreA
MKYYVEYSETKTKEVTKEEFKKQSELVFKTKERIAQKYDDNCITLILW